MIVEVGSRQDKKELEKPKNDFKEVIEIFNDKVIVTLKEKSLFLHTNYLYIIFAMIIFTIFSKIKQTRES